MKIACIQLNIDWENQNKNFLATEKLIKKAKNLGTELVCLPELFSTGVTENTFKFAEEINGKTFTFLSEQAKENKIYLIGSFIMNVKSSLPRNVAIIFGPNGKPINKYEKIHLFTYNKENKFYSSGNKLVVFKKDDFKIAPFICYDLRFPEVFRIAVKKGTNVFVVIASWPNPRKEQWTSLLKARAIENQSFVIGVNRVGNSPKLSFFGNSMIISSKGEIIAQAGEKEEILIGEIKIEDLEDWRKRFTALKDVRKDCYGVCWKNKK